MSVDWKSKVASGEAHWVTVKDESSPMHGRHLLIEGPRGDHGRILAGKGVPTHIIEKLNDKGGSKVIPHTQNPPRDLKNTPFNELTKAPPTKEEVRNHLLEHYPDHYKNRDGGVDEEHLNETADDILKHYKEMHENPDIARHAQKELEFRRDPKYGMDPDWDYVYKARALKRAAEHSLAAEKERKAEEERRASAPPIPTHKVLGNDDLGYIAWKQPSLEELKAHFRAKRARLFEQTHGRPMTEADLEKDHWDNPDKQAEQIHAMLGKLDTENKRTAAQRVADSETFKSITSGKLTPDNVRELVNRALIEALTTTHVTKDGTVITVNPSQRFRYKTQKTKTTPSRQFTGYKVTVIYPDGKEQAHYTPSTPKGRIMDKHFAEAYLNGIGHEGQEFIKHVFDNYAKNQTIPPFKPKGPTRGKPTAAYAPLEQPEKSSDPKLIKQYMAKVSKDLYAHGASNVLDIDDGYNFRKEGDYRKAEVAYHVATSMRALYHLSGGKFPPVGIVLGNANPSYSKTNIIGSSLAAAFYSRWGRSITIDNVLGKDTFFHEFGHFVDDFFGGHTGTYATYKDGHEFQQVINELKRDEAYKQRQQVKMNDYTEDPTEIFARFFDQWIAHEAAKRGYDLPDALTVAHQQKARTQYESYSPETLDRVGAKLEKVLRSAGLWKGLISMLYLLSKQTREESK